MYIRQPESESLLQQQLYYYDYNKIRNTIKEKITNKNEFISAIKLENVAQLEQVRINTIINEC